MGDPVGGAGEDNPTDLINVAFEELVRQRYELPGYTILDEMTASIRTAVNDEFFAMVLARPDRAQTARLASVLVVDPARRRSEFDRIKGSGAVPGEVQGSPGAFANNAPIGPTERWLDDAGQITLLDQQAAPAADRGSRRGRHHVL